MRLESPVVRYGSDHSGGADAASGEKNERLKPDDHDFGGLHESGDGLAFFQAQFADCISGDDGGDALAADRKGDLRDEAVNFYVGDAADELVASTDATKVGAAFGNVGVLVRSIKKPVNFFLGDAVVAAGGFYGANFLFVDPLFQRGIADSEDLCGVAWREEFGCGHEDPPGLLRLAWSLQPKRSEQGPMLSEAWRGCQSVGRQSWRQRRVAETRDWSRGQGMPCPYGYES
jgi:hypothetical protein